MSHQETTDLVDTTTAVAKDEIDLLNKRVETVLPMPQLVQVSFRVHYITHSPKQILAVTGNQQELGSWESFVPLRSVEDGFWFCTVSLPLDSQVEWKFILVEEGRIQRWEECENRCFTVTGQEEEIHLNRNWGYA
ncbi:Starch-binding domain-containing protein 1 [Bagarius yarrelli]|uniref:Starch-binding domain-containing protein 1 n=1 Tax=Bagarius yarrelli TaxID=175774 RepID=A0A556TU50_BAGYA|nr:Starch-binding domain-containing protein 1 [Bagarius yarrelli]